MMEEVAKVYDVWRDIMDNKSDLRTTNWFMMSSPFPTMGVSLAYIFTVKVLGPRFMKNRKAFNIEKIQLVFNILHLLLNVCFFAEGIRVGWLSTFSLRCEPCDVSPAGYATARGSYFYFLSKFTDFFETIIFVLGKRFDLVNTYHVAHHSIMPASVWWGVKFLPGGHATFFGFLNVFVHIVIYSYLVLVASFPNVKPYFGWWKTFLPIFQIVQFALIFIHAFQLFYKNECNFPMAFVYFIGGHGVLFFLILMYELKWSKPSKKLTGTPETFDNKKKTMENESLIHESQSPMISKNFDTVFNYDSFIRILSSRKEKTI